MARSGYVDFFDQRYLPLQWETIGKMLNPSSKSRDAFRDWCEFVGMRKFEAPDLSTSGTATRSIFVEINVWIFRNEERGEP